MPVTLLLALSTCAPEEPVITPLTEMPVPFVPQISINEVMVGQIDHAAHPVLMQTLEADSTMTLGAWQELEHYGIQLQSSVAALTMGGTGANDAMWVAQTDWREYVNQLNEAAGNVITAARQQDMAQLVTAAEQMRRSCDGCHQQYKPEFPTEGFYRIH